jgi:hypothetical protein
MRRPSPRSLATPSQSPSALCSPSVVLAPLLWRPTGALFSRISSAPRAPPPIRHRVKAPPMVPGRHLTARLVRASGQKRTGRWRRARRVNEPRRQDLAGAARQCLSSRLIDAARSLRRAPLPILVLSAAPARWRRLLGALRGDALQKGVTGPAAVQFRGKAFPPKTLFPARAQKRLVLKL